MGKDSVKFNERDLRVLLYFALTQVIFLCSFVMNIFIMHHGDFSLSNAVIFISDPVSCWYPRHTKRSSFELPN